MKKSNILIAAVAVMISSASTVRAEEFNVDFDKGSFNTGKFIETVKAQETNQAAIPSRVFSLAADNAGNSKTDYAIRATIKHCEKNKVDETLTADLKKLLLYGTAEEKEGFNTPEKYLFPKRLNAFVVVNNTDRSFAENKSIGNCVKWASKNVCRDKEIWQTACLAGTVWCFTVAGGSCGPAGAACALVNRIVSECVPVPYCVEWDSETIPGFGNPGVI